MGHFMCRQPFFHVCHRPDGLEDNYAAADTIVGVCHRPDGLNITPLIIYQINFQSNSK